MASIIPLQIASRSLDTGSVVQYPQGGEIGRAVQGAGAEFSELADRVQARQDQMDRFKRIAIENEFDQAVANQSDDLARNAPADGSGIHDGIVGQIDPTTGAVVKPGLFDNLAQQFRGRVPASQKGFFDASLNAKRLTVSGSAASAQYGQEQKYATLETAKIQDGLLNSILQTDPGDAASYEAYKEKGRATIEASPLAPLAKQAALDAWDQQAPKALAQAITAKDPGKLRALLGMTHSADEGGGNAVDEVTDRIIGVESGGNPNAKNPKSSASGVGQFLDSTWVATIRQHRPDLAAGKSAAQIIEMKGDASLGREMTRAYQQDNADYLTNRGLPTTRGNIYLAHFLGPAGATEVLKADPNTPVVNVVGQDVVNANPFLKGMTAADTAAWAAKKMGGAAPATVKPDPRLAMLSPDDRLALANADDVAFRQKQAADKAQASADYGAYKDAYELNIVQGKVSDENLISNDPTLRDGDKASLIRSLRSQNETLNQTQADLVALQNGNLAVDPYSSQGKTRVDNLYAESLKHVDPDKQGSVAAAIIRQTGVTPQAVVNSVRLGLASQDPGQVVAAAQTAQRISQLDPAALGRRDGGSEVQKAADDFTHMVNDLNMAPADAAKRLVDLRDPTKMQARKALEPAAKEYVKSLASFDLAGQFKTGVISGTPTVGLTPEQELGIKADFIAIAEDMFYQKNGDPDLATNAAVQQMRALYGVSDIAGNHVLIKHPPEMSWPKQTSQSATTMFGLMSIPGTAPSPWQYAITQLHNDIDEMSGRGTPGPLTKFEGRLEVGNVDLANRPQVKNADGSISTVRSMSFEEDGKEILIPTVSPDGKILSDQDAIDLYHKTGQHLGKFDTPEHADAYAQALHQSQERYYRGDLQIDPASIRLVSTPETDADVKAGRVAGYAVMWKDANGNLQALPGKLWRPDVTKMLEQNKAAAAREQATKDERANERDLRIISGQDRDFSMDNMLGGNTKVYTPERRKQFLREEAAKPKSSAPGANIPADIPAPDDLQATPGNAM